MRKEGEPGNEAIVALCMHHVLYHLSIYNVLQLAEQHGVQFFETSAWTNEHVKEPFEALASQILEDVRAFITFLYESKIFCVNVAYQCFKVVCMHCSTS